MAIQLENGDRYDLVPVGEQPGTYQDQEGRAAPRAGEGLQASLAPLPPVWEKGLGDEGRLKVAHRINILFSTLRFNRFVKDKRQLKTSLSKRWQDKAKGSS